MKTSVIYYIIAFLGSFFLEIQQALLAIGFLIMTDTFTGIWAAWNEGAKAKGSWKKGFKHVQSRKMGRIIIKLILYPLAVIVSKVAQDYLTPAIPWVDVTTGILAVIEVKSIFENMSKLLGYDLWLKIKKRIWSDKLDEDGN